MNRKSIMIEPARSFSFGPVWTEMQLKSEVQALFGTRSKIAVIANREPCVHSWVNGKVEATFPVSGLVSALDPVVRACSGLWVAHGSGNADRETVNCHNIVKVSDGSGSYALKRVWLTPEEEDGYYYGFSNEGIWPLCHIVHNRPKFRVEDWNAYKAVNRKFAMAFLEEPTPNKIALVQDYHFALVPQFLREQNPNGIVGLFWHIPWSNPDVMRICPWMKEILIGMLHADLIGFQTRYHCNNFMDCVDRFLEARVDRETFSVCFQGHVCYLRPYPIGVAWPTRPPVGTATDCRREIVDQFNLSPNAILGVGVDRVDYTKGIIERFQAVEKLLDDHPDLVGRFSLLQIGAPSRTKIKEYEILGHNIREEARRINSRFGAKHYQPILFFHRHFGPKEIQKYYRAADVCIVNSLHDGMNLVAKEFVASREDLGGMLVLSRFTGAAREMHHALLVHPYDIDETAEAIFRAVTMGDLERSERMRRLRQVVAENNVYRWAGRFISDIHWISEQRQIQRAFYEPA